MMRSASIVTEDDFGIKRSHRRKTHGAICEPSIIRRRRTFKKLQPRRKKPSEEFVGCLPLIFGMSVLSSNAAEVEVSGDLFRMPLISFAIERFRSLRGIGRLQRRLTVVPRQCFRLCHGGLGIFQISAASTTSCTVRRPRNSLISGRYANRTFSGSGVL